MADDIHTLQAILAIDPTAEVTVYVDGTMKWNTTPIAEEDISAKKVELQAEYDAQEYARNRKTEYPSIEELVVALYDSGDKSAIDEKRAAVKLKYPKP